MLDAYITLALRSVDLSLFYTFMITLYYLCICFRSGVLLFLSYFITHMFYIGWGHRIKIEQNQNLLVFPDSFSLNLNSWRKKYSMHKQT